MKVCFDTTQTETPFELSTGLQLKMHGQSRQISGMPAFLESSEGPHALPGGGRDHRAFSWLLFCRRSVSELCGSSGVVLIMPSQFDVLSTLIRLIPGNRLYADHDFAYKVADTRSEFRYLVFVPPVLLCHFGATSSPGAACCHVDTKREGGHAVP